MKRRRPIGGVLFLLFIVLFSACVTRKAGVLPAYTEIRQPIGERYLYPPSQKEVDSLTAIYGQNKTLIDKYAHILIVALSYYPELKEVKIKFEYSREKTTMACRPTRYIFPRVYKVLINSDKNFDGIPFDSIPYNAAVGIVGHELAHIVDYERLNFFGLIDRLFLYVHSKKGKLYFEKSIDLITIKRGLGWQLYDWAQYAMFDNTMASQKYKDFKKRVYLTPDEIREYITHYANYAYPNAVNP